MILEAFSRYLHVSDPEVPATSLLARWLWERLSAPAETVEDRVLHLEISIECSEARSDNALELDAWDDGPAYVFNGRSPTGDKLLKALYQYCLSYEQQKWARWVHEVKASDFGGSRGY